MGVASALLHWRPRDFWSSTPHEFYAALEGYERAHPPQPD